MDKPDRETLILERILSLKQMIREGRAQPTDYHELGVCFFHLKNYDQAAESLSELTKLYPDYLEIASVHALRVFCLLQEARYEEAGKILKERLKLYPEDIRLLSMFAHIKEKQNLFMEAVDLHRRILKIAPDHVNSLNSVGYLLTLYGKPEDMGEASNCLKRVLQLKPDYPAYLDSFGVFLGKRGQKENARKALMKALRKAPENAEILQHLKEVLHI